MIITDKIRVETHLRLETPVVAWTPVVFTVRLILLVHAVKDAVTPEVVGESFIFINPQRSFNSNPFYI